MNRIDDDDDDDDGCAGDKLADGCLLCTVTGIYCIMPAKAAKTSTKRQNIVLARGINAIAANSLSKTNGRFKFSKKGGDKKVVAAKKASTKKWYPADYIPKPLPSAKTARNSVKTAKLRKSIVPGSVLILLSGRFRGKRVVFLKQLESGLLLVTGKSSMFSTPLGIQQRHHPFLHCFGSYDANFTSRGNRSRTVCGVDFFSVGGRMHVRGFTRSVC